MKRVIVANRGAVARRVIRALRALGIESVAVHAEADRDMPYLSEADLAVPIGPSPAVQSYLNQETLLRVAAVESTTLLGGLLGWIFLRQVSDYWLSATVAHVGGGFIFLAVHAVLGEILKHHKGLVLTSFAIGFGAIAGLTVLLRLL